jgi:two-component system alkaline phosphatase synthesis response regulator PhoP
MSQISRNRRIQLSQEGYQIVTAVNGKDAIVKAKKEIPDLIIMDVMMPEMDGMEL